MKKLHLWLSLPAGLFITVICLTGAILVFQQELLEMFNRERYFVTPPAGSTALHLDTLVARNNRALGGDTIAALKIFPDARRTVEATLSFGARSYVYLNPYTAEITGYYNARAGFFHKAMTLHRWLMLPNREAGRLIVGVSTLFLIGILLSGVVRWARKTTFQIKWKRNWRRKVYDLHRVLGIYVALFLLLCALTGPMWSFGWYRSAVAGLFGMEPAKSERPAGKEDFQPGQNTPSDLRVIHRVSSLWQTAYELTSYASPQAQHITIRSSGGISVLPANAPHPRATDVYQYHKGEGKLALLSRYGEVKNQGFLMGLAYVLHVGSWGGILTRWLTFLAALLGASLPITGYILFLARQISLTQRTR